MSSALPSASSQRFLSKEELQRHFYTTSSQRDYTEKTLTEEDKSESMKHVHNVGKTYGKYLPYKWSKAPLLDRDACLYTREYNKPNIAQQYNQNKDIATFNKGPRTKFVPSAQLEEWKSKYTQDFPGQTTSELKKAKPELWLPEKGGTLETVLGGKGKLLVTKSHLQSTHHGVFNQSFDVNGVAITGYEGNIQLQGYHSGDYQRTKYFDDFSGKNMKRAHAVGSAFRLQRGEMTKIEHSGSTPLPKSSSAPSLTKTRT
jgi:hypothetical protein